ncbi:MAG: V4R domain-containing protein [Candidatus Micrarchaeia archaeon]
MTAKKPKAKKARARLAPRKRKRIQKKAVAQAKKKNKTSLQQQVASIEELLTKNILDEKSERTASPILPAVLYNLNAATRSLAYQLGYDLGYKICATTRGGINALLTVLKNAGLGDMLYYPFSDMARISTLKKSPIANVGMRMHNYEAGIISGFMSNALSRKINVTESKCIYNGDERCEFIASPSPQANETAGSEQASITTNSLGSIMNHLVASPQDSGTANGSYVMLKLAPFTRQPLLNATAKLFSSLGGNMNGSDLGKLARFLPGIEKIEVSRRKRRISGISVKYSKEYSSMPYVALSSPFILGASASVLGTHSKEPKVAIKLNNDSSYTLEIKRQTGK